MSSVILSSPFSNSSIPAHPVLVPNSPAAGTRVVPGPRPGGGRLIELPRGVMSGSRLELRPDPARVPSGVRKMDALTGGLPRGALTEIFGPASSGRTSLLLAALAEVTQRQEVCAISAPYPGVRQVRLRLSITAATWWDTQRDRRECARSYGLKRPVCRTSGCCPAGIRVAP